MSEIKPAHAFIECPEHGRVGMTFAEFTRQLATRITEPWKCPICDQDVWLDSTDFFSRHEKDL